MADRVAEGRIPEEAVKAGLDAFEWYEDADEPNGDFRAAFYALVRALPSEWLLAKALDPLELEALITSKAGWCSEAAHWRRFHAINKLRAALSVLEQEAGGEPKETDLQKAERLRALAIREGWHDAV